MKRAWLCVPLLASMALAQSGNKLDADLLSLGGTSVAAASQQLANDMLSLADTNPQPSRRVVLDFTDELTRALVGKRLTAEAVSQLTSAILDVIHSDGVPTWRYRESLERTRQALIAMGVSTAAAKRVADRLTVVGQQVRGPEDLPVSAPRIAAPK